METSSQESQPDNLSSEDTSPTRGNRGLRERKKVVYNEKKMAKKASTDSSDEDDDGEMNDDDLMDDDEVDEEAKRRPMELWAEGESAKEEVSTEDASQDSKASSGAVTGHELFGFKKTKRKDALVKTVAYSTNAARSESEAAMEEKGTATPKKVRTEDVKTEAPPRTPSAGRRGRKPNKSHLLKTPHRLRRRIDHGIDLDDDSDPSFSEGSEDDDDESDFDDDNDEDSQNNNEKKTVNSNKAAPATPSLFDKKAIIATPTTKATPSKALKAGGKRVAESKSVAQQSEEAESYFEAHKSSQVFTSDHTLSKLETPKLSPEQVAGLLADSPSHHAPQIQELLESHATLFRKWMLQMASNYSVLLYGLGSKRQLLEMFRQNYLAEEYDHVTINGYFPGLTVKQIFSCIIDELFDAGSRTFKTPQDQLSFLAESLRTDPRDFFLVFHNIDGVNLRKAKTQQIISQLASLPGCHLIASVDHINAPLLWDQTKLSKFRWIWYDATTFCPYIDETSYETSLMIQQSGQLALSSLLHVIKSLTPNAKKIFVLLATEQLALGDTPTYQGMSFQDLYQRCRAEFLVNSDLTLKAQLTEFKDHKLIRVKKGNDGVEYLTIPLDNSTIIEFMEDYEA